MSEDIGGSGGPETVARAFREFADLIGNVRQSYDDLDAETAFWAAVEAIRDAAIEISTRLEDHSQDYSIRQIIAIEGIAAKVGGPEPVHADEGSDSLDSGVTGRAKINIPGIKQGKVLLVIDEKGGNLAIELELVDQAIGRDEP